jgi:hypothetical protein
MIHTQASAHYRDSKCSDKAKHITHKPQAKLGVSLLGQNSQSARALRPLSASAFQRHAVPTPGHVRMELGHGIFFFSLSCLLE